MDGFRQLCTRTFPTNRTINIVFHGHSVPAGYTTNLLVRTFDAYPHLVHRALSERFSNATINVIVTGKGSESSEDGAKRFDEDVLRMKPDLILIDYALNDRRIGLPRAHKAWAKMIHKAGSVPIILITPNPDLRQDYRSPTNALYQHAEQIRQLAKSEGVSLADTAAVFNKLPLSEVTNLMSHPVHPNRQGHEKMAAGIVGTILNEGVR